GTYFAEAAPILRAVADLPLLSVVLVLLGTYLPDADATQRRALVEEGLAMARATGEPFTIACTEFYARPVRLRIDPSDVAGARAHNQEALRLARALDADWLLARALEGAGILA